MLPNGNVGCPALAHLEPGAVPRTGGHAIALNVLTNCFNLLAEVENDWPVVPSRGDAA